jgi:hypothetical protein
MSRVTRFRMGAGLAVAFLSTGACGGEFPVTAAPKEPAARHPAAAGPSLSEVELGSPGVTCQIASIACGHLSIDEVGSQWEVVAGTYFKNASDTGVVDVTGTSQLYKNHNTYPAYDSQQDLRCHRTANACGDFNWYTPTCSVEHNRLWAYTANSVVTIAGHYYGNSAQWTHTCEPAEDPCGSGGGGGWGDETDYATGIARPKLRSSGPRANDCGSGAGGTEDSYCSSVYLVIEISYDGGATWSTLWEGEAQECDYEE